MNARAAEIAWRLIMDRTRIVKLMAAIDRDDEAAYKQALAFLYAVIEPILAFPAPDK